MTLISRRKFLLFGSSVGAALGLWHIAGAVTRTSATGADNRYDAAGYARHALMLDTSERDFIQPRPARLDLWGRITGWTPVRQSPGMPLSPHVDQFSVNTVLPLFESIEAEGPNPHNNQWYHVENGYIYTSTVQPMKPYRMPEIVTDIDAEAGFWAEVIVPYSIPRLEPSGTPATAEAGEPMVHYYSTVHRVIGAQADAAGHFWYKVHDDKPPKRPVYVLARHMLRISPETLTPINPGKNKRIVIDLAAQRLDCYEDERLVFSTLTSTGGDGFETPRGEWWVVLKQPSRHMYSDPAQEAFSDPNFFDLPGVPYIIFFTTLGHAIHGTYWHGDYGRPRSHGCANVLPEAAEWLYRWVEPVAPYSSDFVPGDSHSGTPVMVI